MYQWQCDLNVNHVLFFLGVLAATKVSNYKPFTDVIQSEANLDREAIEVYNFTVDCIIKYLDEPKETEVVRIDGTLVVLDENDNPPIRQENTSETLIMSLSEDGHQMKPVRKILDYLRYKNLQ